MNIEEIFSTLIAHMQKGLLIHQQFADTFSFLNLYGYQKCHEYHYFEESYNCRCLYNFYMNHYYKLLPPQNIETPNFIPSSWYKHNKMDVDSSTKRTAIKEVMQHWVDWETDTKKLLEESYKNLYEIGEVDAARKISSFLKDVSKELKNARKKQLDLDSSGYDLTLIIEEQDDLHKKYKKKIGDDK